MDGLDWLGWDFEVTEVLQTSDVCHTGLKSCTAYQDRFDSKKYSSNSSKPNDIDNVFSQPSIYIDGWLYGMRMTSVVCNVLVLSQNDSTYHHSVFTT